MSDRAVDVEGVYLQLAEEAQRASQAKSRFLASISHEIRTPLGIILGFTELALASKDTTEVQSCLEAIQRNGQYLNGIIGDVLDFSRIEANHLEITPVEICLASLLQDVRAHLAIKAQDKGLRFLIESQAPLPAHIRADHVRLKQILFNIVGNALKFTQDGRVVLRVACETPPVPGAEVRLRFEIEDTGPGIPETFRENLFQPFMRAEDDNARLAGGTGLGLTISRQLARAMGGDVVLERSEAGRGTVFRCAISGGPYDGHALDLLARPAPAESQAAPFADLRHLRVLLVDDCVDNQVLIHHSLKDALHLDFASNGQDGLRLATENDYDVILMDLQMPVLNGMEATRRLRASGSRTPILALTADAQAEEREKAMRHGFDAYLIKPVPRQTLIDAIRKAVAPAGGRELSKVPGQMEFSIEDRASLELPPNI